METTVNELAAAVRETMVTEGWTDGFADEVARLVREAVLAPGGTRLVALADGETLAA